MSTCSKVDVEVLTDNYRCIANYRILWPINVRVLEHISCDHF